jgi:membrane glycosyltransferase
MPSELQRTRALAEQAEAAQGRRDDWVAAIVDPRVHSVVAGAARVRSNESQQRRDLRAHHVARALIEGPAALDAGARRGLLRDRLALLHLHRLAWSHSRAHHDWQAARADWHRSRGERGLPVLVPVRGSFDERLLDAAREHRATVQRELALAS